MGAGPDGMAAGRPPQHRRRRLRLQCNSGWALRCPPLCLTCLLSAGLTCGSVQRGVGGAALGRIQLPAAPAS